MSGSLNKVSHKLSRNSSDGPLVNEYKGNPLGVPISSYFTTHSTSDRLFSLIDHREETIDLLFSEEVLKSWQSEDQYVNSVRNNKTTDSLTNKTPRSKFGVNHTS